MKTVILIIPYYIRWHYGRGVAEGIAIYKDVVWFLYNFFSISVLLRTFFSPWERLGEEYVKKPGIHPGEYFSTLTVNTIMRGVGILLRTGIIIAGLIAVAVASVAGVAVFIGWIGLPLIIVSLVALGVKELLI